MSNPEPNRIKRLSFRLLVKIAIAGALQIGLIQYYHQYPSQEVRRELSVQGMFLD